jgi:hypothetical protein
MPLKKLFCGGKSAEEGQRNPENMLKDKIKEDSVLALKSHDGRKVEVLRYLISLIDKKEMQMPVGEMKEEDEVAVVRKELKNKEESKEMFLKGNRNDLAEQLDYEIVVVKEYLPKGLDEVEIVKFVDEAIANVGNNFGMVMKEVVSKVAGRAGGDVISKIVKEKISGQ